MFRQGKDLPAQTPSADLDLGFDERELAAHLEELTGELTLPRIQPGDVTRAMLCQRAGCSRSRVDALMEKKERAGEYVKLRVVGDHGHWMDVWRKVEPKPNRA